MDGPARRSRRRHQARQQPRLVVTQSRRYFNRSGRLLRQRHRRRAASSTRRKATNTAAVVDSINNVENVFISPPLGTNYSITVIGRDVNVNAVTAQTNNVVQDFALVISCGEGEVTNAISRWRTTASFPIPRATRTSVFSAAPTERAVAQPVCRRELAAAGHQHDSRWHHDGAEYERRCRPDGSPYAANAIVTLGMTNQWHFYVVTNPVGGAADVTNAAFITFLPDTLSIPRMGVFADSTANATRPEADIDLYVTTDSTLTNLNPVAISNCVYGTQVGVSAARRFQRGVPWPRRHGIRRGHQFHARPGLLRGRVFGRPDGVGIRFSVHLHLDAVQPDAKRQPGRQRPAPSGQHSRRQPGASGHRLHLRAGHLSDGGGSGRRERRRLRIRISATSSARSITTTSGTC